MKTIDHTNREFYVLIVPLVQVVIQAPICAVC